MAVGKCAKCGRVRELVKNHKNGHHGDNSPGNVERICNQCHAEYHHYPKGQNSGTPIRGN